MSIMKQHTITIDGRIIGADQPPYIIAELSANHNGSLERALQMMQEAKNAGADAFKLQTYTPDTMTIDHDGKGFVIEGGLWNGEKLHDLYSRAMTPWPWHETLFTRGRELGITVFSSPFDESAVELLESLDAPAYKIASFEVVDIPLIKRVAQTGKPVIMSTGMASLGEIEHAVAVLRENGCTDLIILHCVSGYPTPLDDVNLKTLPHLHETFSTVTGLSDHTLGNAVAIGAVALGAAVIEKHFILSRDDGGPDSAFSIEPQELCELVESCRAVWRATGKIEYGLKSSEKSMHLFRRSLYVVADVPAGGILSPDNIRCIRPGHGLAPMHYDDVIGQHARFDLTKGMALKWSMVD